MNKRFLLWMQRILWGLDIIILTGVFILIQKYLLHESFNWEYVVLANILWIIVAWHFSDAIKWYPLWAKGVIIIDKQICNFQSL